MLFTTIEEWVGLLIATPICIAAGVMVAKVNNHKWKEISAMSDARKNRGTGNGGEAYRNSSFWGSVENKEEPKRPSAPAPMPLRFNGGTFGAEAEMEKAGRAMALFGKAFLVDGKFVEHHRVQVLIKGE